jgi:hypothetical protein
MRRTALLSVVAALALSVGGCQDPAGPGAGVIREGDVIAGTGRIVWCAFEGGFYGLLGDDKQLYEPLGVPGPLLKDGIRVRFTGRVRTDLGSFRMVGPIVEITSIRRL